MIGVKSISDKRKLLRYVAGHPLKKEAGRLVLEHKADPKSSTF